MKLNKRPNSAAAQADRPIATSLGGSAWAALGAGAALLALPGCGSSSGPRFFAEGDTPASIEADTSDVRVDLPGRISMFLQVEEADGTPAAGLEASDFQIYENDVLVSQSESFQQIRAQPQLYRSYLHLVLDRSNSVQTSGETALKAGAREFVELLAQDDQTTFIKISWFDGSPEIFPIPGHDIGYTDSHDALMAAINALDEEPPNNGSTNLYGAIVSGIADLDEVDVEANLAGVQNRSLTLVTFTDGTHQSGDSVTLGDARAALDGQSPEGTGYSAFTIGVGAEIDPAVLALLGPNGSVAESNLDALDIAFLNIGGQVQDLANSFYSLTYCSPKTSGVNMLRVSVNPDPTSTAGDVTFEFDATGFGAGCAFLDDRSSAEISNGSPRTFMADSLEASDGSVYAVGWRTAGCLEPGCGSSATAFIVKFQASPADEDGGGDGRLDTSFGSNGILELQDVSFDVSGATCITRSTLNPGGFVVGGWARPSSSSGFSRAVVWEVAPNGAGAMRVDLGSVAGQPEADQAIADLIALPSGSYIAGGFYGTSQRRFTLWGLFSNLDPDAGFGDNGVVLGGGGAFDNRGVESLVLGGGGRVYAGGEVSGALRILGVDSATGDPVNAFDGDGTLELSGIVGGIAYPVTLGGMLVDGQGRLVLAGSIVGAPPQVGTGTAQPALWRVLTNGALDRTFRGSFSSPTTGTGLVTLRSSVTGSPLADFGGNTVLNSVAIGPDGTILAAGQRQNSQSHTDLAIFAFEESGIPRGAYNFVGFSIYDGTQGTKSFESGSLMRVLSSGAIWAIGVGYPSLIPPMSVIPQRDGPDVPVVWVDRDPSRAFAPLGGQ